MLAELDKDRTVSPARDEWLVVSALTASIVLLATLPYLWGYSIHDGNIFDGFLFGVADSHSYIAKMRQGFTGEWLFTLPFTAEPGPGVFLYSYYLFLGHVASWIDVPNLQLVYHSARLLNSVLFLLLAYRFIARFFITFRQRVWVWLLFALGSGMGWLTSWVGMLTADLWVFEAIPFLTVFSYAHFPLVWALTLWLFELTLPGLTQPPPTWSHAGWVALAVTLLAQIAPMMLLVVGVVLSGLAGWRLLAEHRVSRAELVMIGTLATFAAPWVLYDSWVMRSHPALAGWNAQNITLSPPVLDLLVSGGVPLVFALVGGVQAARRRRPLDRLLLAWAVLNALLLYAPISLQRRLILGLWMPVAILAGQGFFVIWPRIAKLFRPLVVAGLIATVLGSNVWVMAAALNAIHNRNDDIFITPAEAASFKWLESRTLLNEIVLAGPVTGMRIPAHSRGRVLYGHKSETVASQARKQDVLDFYSGRIAPDRFLERYPVDYIYYGPDERKLGALPSLNDRWHPVFTQGDVVIYGK